MTSIGEHVPLCFCILHKILAHYLLLIEDLHGVLAACRNGFAIFFQIELLYDIDLTKGSLT